MTTAHLQGGPAARAVNPRCGLSLFDLEDDVGETTNVAEQHPEIVARIVELAERMRAELGDKATDRQGAGVRPAGRLEEGDQRFDWMPGEPIQVDSRSPQPEGDR